MDAPSLEWAPLTSTMAVDGEGARDDDAVSFSSDVDEPGLDADIDADDIAALLDEREAAAPDEPLALATVARRNLPDDFLQLAGPEDIARAVAKLDQVRLDRCRLASFVGPGMSVAPSSRHLFLFFSSACVRLDPRWVPLWL